MNGVANEVNEIEGGHQFVGTQQKWKLFHDHIEIWWKQMYKEKSQIHFIVWV
jgi:hypothetical protein